MGRPPKRKADEAVSPETSAEKKADTSGGSRKKRNVEATASSTRPIRTSPRSLQNTDATPHRSRRVSDVSSKNTPIAKKGKAVESTPTKKPVGRPKKGTAVKVTKKAKKPVEEVVTASSEEDEFSPAKLSVSVRAKKSYKKKGKFVDVADESEEEADDDGPQYWLMKAEPDSRIEKGIDVKFSIDDLKAATAPEPWDGVRNLEARNNMRAMTVGDKAFFYHSNCKQPGIVGIMEIVQEHSVDQSAFDKDHPYYDEKSNRENPKWHCVHVKFFAKFPEIIKLNELQIYAKEGGVLENMQSLKRKRLSVSKVSKKEWDFIMDLVGSEIETAADAASSSTAHQSEKVDGQAMQNGVGEATAGQEDGNDGPVTAAEQVKQS